jgi:hypothetical protein
VAQRRVSNQCGNVDRRPRLADRGKIRGKGWITESLRVAQQVHRIGRFATQADRRGADAAVADNDRRNSLGKFGQHLRSANHRGVIMCMNIDEARSEHQALGVHTQRGIVCKTWSDLANAAGA